MKKKQTVQVQESASPAYYLPNIMGYVRFVTIVASWKYAMSDPHCFAMLYGISYLLGALDGTVARLLSQCSFFGA